MHGQLASTRKMNKLKAELGFEKNVKVVEKFFKFQIDFEIKIDLKNCAGNRKFLRRIFRKQCINRNFLYMY